MAVVAVFVHHEHAEARALALDAVAWLTDRGHEVRVLADDAATIGRPDLVDSPEGIVRGLDLAVSLGGDGTMLRAVRVVGAEAPVIGVNLGQLGYLTEIEPTGLHVALKRFLAGSYDLEQRMLLDVASDGALESDRALNEVVIEKTPEGTTVRLGVWIDGSFFATYAADGLIVATPTGSTAYAFSARGPIVSPTHRALMLTPVSPHMLFDRTLVLDETAEIRIEVMGPHPAAVSVDGRPLGTCEPAESITCTRSAHSARLVTFGERDFLRIVTSKFGLAPR